MTERIYKTWGQRFLLFKNDLCEVCYLSLVPYQRCSYHQHNQKSNFFFVIEGQLGIKTQWGHVVLGPNEFFTVHPPDWHEFQTYLEPVKMIEVAYVELHPEDIKRDVNGGPLIWDKIPAEIRKNIVKENIKDAS